MLEPIVSCILLACAFPAFTAAWASGPILVPNPGSVTVLNVNNTRVDRECLIEGVKRVVDLFDRNELVPYRMKIWIDHTVVKEALSGETVAFDRDSGTGDSLRLLIPVKYGGDRIIAIKKQGQATSYEMLGLPDHAPKMDFSACLK